MLWNLALLTVNKIISQMCFCGSVCLPTCVGETGEQPLLGFRLIKIYLHILQQICLIQKEDACIRYDYRPSVQF